MEARDDTGFESKVSPRRRHESGGADSRCCIRRRQLAAVSRRAGGVAADDPALPDTWGPTQNVAWKIDMPGRRGARRSCGAITSSSPPRSTPPADKPLRPTSEYISRSGGGTMTFQDLETHEDADHRWVALRRRLQDRQGALGARGRRTRCRRRRGTRRTATPRKRRSPTASASTPTSATSACSPST